MMLQLCQLIIDRHSNDYSNVGPLICNFDLFHLKDRGACQIQAEATGGLRDYQDGGSSRH
jgi:hypothetical protein